MQPDPMPMRVSGIKHSDVPLPIVVEVDLKDRRFLELRADPIHEGPALRFRFPGRDLADDIAPFAYGAGLFLHQVGQDPSAVLV